MKRKNTQNAEKPTKDTRQYKYTPSKTKRAVGKIFALVGCFALLLSCVVVPSFADTYGQGFLDPVAITPSPYFPSAVSVPVYGGLDDELGYITMSPTLPFSEPYNTTQYSTSYTLPSGDYIVDTAISQDGVDDGIVSQYVDFSSNENNFELTESTPLIFEYSPFYYNESAGEYLPNNNSTVGNSLFITTYSRPTQPTESIKSVYFIKYSLDDGANYETRQLTATLEGDSSYINLRGLFEQLGLLHSSVYVETLSVRVFDPDGNAQLDSFTCFINEDNYQPSRPTSTVPEAIDTVGLFDWIVEGIQGMLETPLIPIGNVAISIGSIVGLALGLVCVMAILKFFAGG